jgi:hypothetical protein
MDLRGLETRMTKAVTILNELNFTLRVTGDPGSSEAMDGGDGISLPGFIATGAVQLTLFNVMCSLMLTNIGPLLQFVYGVNTP